MKRKKVKVRRHGRRTQKGITIVKSHIRRLKSLDKWMFSKERLEVQKVKKEFVEWRTQVEKDKEEREKALCQNASVRGPGIGIGQCCANKVERKVVLDYGGIKNIAGEKDIEILYLCNDCTQRLKQDIKSPYVKRFGYTIKTYPVSTAP